MLSMLQGCAAIMDTTSKGLRAISGVERYSYVGVAGDPVLTMVSSKKWMGVPFYIDVIEGNGKSQNSLFVGSVMDLDPSAANFLQRSAGVLVTETPNLQIRMAPNKLHRVFVRIAEESGGMRYTCYPPGKIFRPQSNRHYVATFHLENDVCSMTLQDVTNPQAPLSIE